MAIDIGGTNVKILLSGESTPRKFPSGSNLTPRQMVSGVKKVAQGWKYDAISIGYPGPTLRGQPINEPPNLGKGWVGFDFKAAFGCPVRLMNDAAMQALGSYKKGKMLFLGLGTGLGSALVVNGLVEPMELGHLPYKKKTYEDYVGLRGLEKYGKKKWRKLVKEVVECLIAALQPDDVVLGGGNTKKLKKLPRRCRAGENANAFIGGFRMWQERRESGSRKRPEKARTRTAARPVAAKAASRPVPVKSVSAKTAKEQNHGSIAATPASAPRMESAGRPQ